MKTPTFGKRLAAAALCFVLLAAALPLAGALRAKALETATLSYTVTPAAPVAGQPFTLTVTVQGNATGGVPTGSVTLGLTGEAKTLSPAGGFNSSATFSVPGLAAGTRPLSADYTGDANYDALLGQSLGSVTVARATPTVTLTASPGPYFVNVPVTLTATVSAPAGTDPGFTPTGTMEFFADGTLIGSASAAGGSGTATATYPLRYPYPGTRSLTASYGGDANFTAGNAAPLNLTVIGEPTITAASPAVVASAGGTTVTLTGTNFTGATGVTLVSGPAVASFSVVNDTTLTFTAPGDTVGAIYDIQVTNPAGTGTGPTLAFARLDTLTPSATALPHTGGTVTATLTGLGLPPGLAVQLLENGSPTGLTGALTGSDATQTATLTVPANTTAAAKTYTLRVALGGDTAADTLDSSGAVGTITVAAPVVHAVESAPEPITQKGTAAVWRFAGQLDEVIGATFAGRALTLTPDPSIPTRWLLHDGAIPAGTLDDGSVIVTLYAAYLDTFENGSYPLRLTFSDGYGDSALEINIPPEADSSSSSSSSSASSSRPASSSSSAPSSSAASAAAPASGAIPQTGDAAALPWAAGLVLALAGTGATFFARRRRK